jgi:hypothetical protein
LLSIVSLVLRFAFVMLLSAASWPAHAKGAFDQVEINLLQIGQSGQFSIVVTPINPSPESLIGLCKQLRIVGLFDSKRWAKHAHVTQKGHDEALALLRTAHTAKKTIHLGELGGGFHVINKTMPCTVRSRGFVHWKEAGLSAALSVYHNF